MKSEKPMDASPHFSFHHRVSPNLAAAIVFIITAALTIIIIWNSEQDRRQIERARISDIAGDYSHTLQHHIERALSATYSLAALVRQGNGDIPDFEATASEMLPFFPGVASLQLAPGGIVQRIVPLAGNENAIGHDLLKDPLRTKEAFLARDTGKLTLAGPFKLVQGGNGAVGRLPVFLETSNGDSFFWGFTIVLIRFPDVLDNAQLSSLEKRSLHYELWRIHPDTGERQAIIASSVVPVKPVDSSLELPNGRWTLSVAPAEGWGDAVGLTIRMALALIISMLLSILAGSLLNTRAAALRIAQKLTIDLKKSEERLRLEVARMPLGYIVWDQDFRVVTWNPAAEAIFGFTYDEAKGLHPYETIVPPEAQPQVESIWERLLSGDTSAHSVNENLTKQKQNIVCEWTNTPLKQSDGTVLGAISMVQDITERKRAEEEIRKLNRELEQRVQERTIELSEKNTKLNREIHERKQAMEELHLAKTQLEEANRLLENLSVTDPLTGLANRRRFDEVLVRELARHARSGVELSLIMLDIDHFKAYNDNYGHVKGDACLQLIAQVIAQNAVRAADVAARYGGEEFACILPETDLQGAVAIAEKIRTGINHLVIPHDFSTTADFVTASFGVVSITCTANMTTSDIIGLADNMLYKAKAGGRNRVERDTFTHSQQSGVEKNFVQLVWSDTFCSGNRLIDCQHQKLFRMSNQLLDAIESFSPNPVINERVTHLLDDITKHFFDEETILESANFPGRKEHAEEHAKLHKRGLEIARTFQSGTQDLGDIVKFLVYEMVFRHMHQKDRDFFPFIKPMYAESE